MPGRHCSSCNSADCHGCSPMKPSGPILGKSSGEHDPNRALHFSEGKSGVDQIPPEVLLEWGQVFTYGETKYFRDNWKRGNHWFEFYGSALRHILAFWQGEDIDPESGLHHLAHAIWNLGTLRYYQLHGLGEDDRTPEEVNNAQATEQRQVRSGSAPES